MEIMHLIEESSDPWAIEFSNKLRESGIEGWDKYYNGEEYSCDFFKIPVPYQKESPNDPDVHYIFVDINNDEKYGRDYTVCGNYAHQHCASSELAVYIIKHLIEKHIVEMCFVRENLSASLFMPSKGSDQDNVGFLLENFKDISDNLNSPIWQENTAGHFHTTFNAEPLFSIMGNKSGCQPAIDGVKTYVVCAEFGKHPEYYILEEYDK
ncbi:MAG: hypothetical protein IJ437_05890 [Clostridia bacterium]|nr:hypothetical protein [Clostridia bacterium]